MLDILAQTYSANQDVLREVWEPGSYSVVRLDEKAPATTTKVFGGSTDLRRGFTFTFVPHSIVLQKTRVEYTYEEGERDKEEVNDI